MSKITVYYTVDKTNPNAKPLFRKHDDDACWDVYAASMRFVEEYYDKKKKKNIPRHYTYGTGLRFAIPKGHHIECYPRSSVFETGMMLSNAPGIVDCGYKGEVMAHFYEAIPNGTIYDVGDRIMQIRLSPARYDEVDFVQVDELPKQEGTRGTCGFGSTGRN